MRESLQGAVFILAAALCSANFAYAGALSTETVLPGENSLVYKAEGVVEAVRTSVIGAEISGQVTALSVKAGDRVKRGQLLARIDERVASQQALASQSQLAAAQAQLAVAQANFERQQKLYSQNFLSKAALDRAESEYKSAVAQSKAQMAQATASGVQTGLHTLASPYDGVVAETDIELGDMVMPGKPLLVVYDPHALRATVNLPQSQLSSLRKAAATVEIPGAATPSFSIAPENVVVLPTADPKSQMVQVRIALPAGAGGLSPGMFARALLPMRSEALASPARITVPGSAIITRSELTAVYVVDDKGHASLRQVRLGHLRGDRVEILAGLDTGEKVALDPLAAARQP